MTLLDDTRGVIFFPADSRIRMLIYDSTSSDPFRYMKTDMRGVPLGVSHASTQAAGHQHLQILGLRTYAHDIEQTNCPR